MTAHLTLIVGEEAVNRGHWPTPLLAKPKLARPNVAVVWADAFGRVAYLGERPVSRGEIAASKYRTRYEVDMSDHRRQASLESSPLPSRGDMYFFRSVVDVGFRVTDPAAVIKRNVTDGLVVVYNFLIDAFRPVTRRYEITDAQSAEEALNLLFLHPAALPEGITIYRCTTRLTPDSRAQEYLRGIDEAGREITLGSARQGANIAAIRNSQEIGGINQQGRFEAENREIAMQRRRQVEHAQYANELGAAEHEYNVAAAQRSAELGGIMQQRRFDADDREIAVQDRRALEGTRRAIELGAVQHDYNVATTRQDQIIGDMRQQARLASQERELAAMAGQSVDLQGILQLHLAKHPDETRYALELLDRYEQAKIVRGEVGDERRLDLFRYLTDRGLIQPVDVEKLRTKTLDEVSAITAPDQGGQAGQAAGSWDEPLSAPAKVVPVYVVVDESVADPNYFDVLNDRFQALPTELAVHSDIIGAIRLAVLGYGDGVQVRMPLNAIGAGSHVPALAHHDGKDLGAVFDDLYSRIPADIDRLKAQGMISGRPIVHLLCAEPVAERPGSAESYRRLTDPASFRYAPTIVVCGIGPAGPEFVGRLATPSQLAWVAAPGTPVIEAATDYLAFVRASIVNVSQAHVLGGQATFAGPDGFRPAAGDAP